VLTPKQVSAEAPVDDGALPNLQRRLTGERKEFTEVAGARSGMGLGFTSQQRPLAELESLLATHTKVSCVCEGGPKDLRPLCPHRSWQWRAAPLARQAAHSWPEASGLQTSRCGLQDGCHHLQVPHACPHLTSIGVGCQLDRE
jgi:hypothetical protein